MPIHISGLINEESKGEEHIANMCASCAKGLSRRAELSELAISSFVIEISIMPKEKPVCYEREHQCDLTPFDLEIAKRGGMQPSQVNAGTSNEEEIHY